MKSIKEEAAKAYTHVVTMFDCNKGWNFGLRKQRPRRIIDFIPIVEFEFLLRRLTLVVNVRRGDKAKKGK